MFRRRPVSSEPLSYALTRHGKIHRASCDRGRRSPIWEWAAGRTPREITNEIHRLELGYIWCRECFPIEERRETFELY